MRMVGRRHVRADRTARARPSASRSRPRASSRCGRTWNGRCRRSSAGPGCAVHLLHDALEIAAELGVGVVGRLDRDVLPMIAKIEYQHVEFGERCCQYGIVGVGREAVAVGDAEGARRPDCRDGACGFARRPRAGPRKSCGAGISNCIPSSFVMQCQVTYADGRRWSPASRKLRCHLTSAPRNCSPGLWRGRCVRSTCRAGWRVALPRG